MKRILFVLAAAGALCLAFAASSALAALSITKASATKGDKVEFKIDGLQDGDIWELRVADGDAQTDSYLKDGFAEGVTEVQGDFEMPDLGTADKNIDIKAYVIREGNTITPAADFIVRMTYTAPVPTGTTGNTGDSGSVGGSATSTAAAAAVPPAAQSPSSTGSGSSTKPKKKTTSTDTKKKSTSDGGKKKSGGATQPESTPSPTPAPVEAPIVEPVTAAAPVDTASLSPSSSSAPSAPEAPPPGPGGPPPTDAVPPAPPPAAPSTGPASVVPVSTIAPDEGLNVPIAIVLLLGLLTLGGLGGAQARMLGLWGPQPRLSPGEARDARLLALGRVAQSGASLQRRIAEHKQTAKERQPLN